MNEEKILIGNVCFIFDPSLENILLLQRAKDPMNGLFTGVGGKTRFDEDIRASCQREIEEETGLHISNLNLKGVVKTILDGANSSWVLFVYTAKAVDRAFSQCPEGVLQWTAIQDMDRQNLIGFIREILDCITCEDCFIEGTFYHDNRGKVLQKTVQRTVATIP